MSKKVQLREAAVYQAATLEVDEQSAVIKGVKVLGLVSKNGRTYTREAIAKALGKYDGAKVNLDHALARPGETPPPRQFAERFGRLKAPVKEANGDLRANLHFNPAHPMAPAFLWWAKNDPGAIGLSHNAYGTVSEQPDGSELVEEILEVYSVDLVGDPATTQGLHEGLTMPTPAPAGEVDYTQPGHEAALGQFVVSVFADGSLDRKAKRKKILAALKLMDDPMSTPANTAEAIQQLRSKQAEDPAVGMVLSRLEALELKEQQVERRKRAVALCGEMQLSEGARTEVFLDLLSCQSDEGRMKALIEDRKAVLGGATTPAPAVGGTTPTSAGKQFTEATYEQFEQGLAKL